MMVFGSSSPSRFRVPRGSIWGPSGTMEWVLPQDLMLNELKLVIRQQRKSCLAVSAQS